MWMCRYCAAHVNDEVLHCPCCAAPAPARLQPELAHSVSEELNEAPRREQIHWLRHIALPNLRKRAESPWSWVMFGFLLGLGCGVANFCREPPPLSGRLLPLFQPFLPGIVLAVVFAMLAATLRWHRNRDEGHISAIEIGMIIGFFIPPIFVVLIAFTSYQGWDSLTYLTIYILPSFIPGVIFAFFAGLLTFSLTIVLKPIAGFLARRFGFASPTRNLPPRSILAKTVAIGRTTTGDADSAEGITRNEDSLLWQSSANRDIRRGND